LGGLVDGYRHREGRDLTGYVDGTKNPKGAKALRVVLVSRMTRRRPHLLGVNALVESTA
jgi:deferrochelatase/peroxidase EfeB